MDSKKEQVDNSNAEEISVHLRRAINSTQSGQSINQSNDQSIDPWFSPSTLVILHMQTNKLKGTEFEPTLFITKSHKRNVGGSYNFKLWTWWRWFLGCWQRGRLPAGRRKWFRLIAPRSRRVIFFIAIQLVLPAFTEHLQLQIAFQVIRAEFPILHVFHVHFFRIYVPGEWKEMKILACMKILQIQSNLNWRIIPNKCILSRNEKKNNSNKYKNVSWLIAVNIVQSCGKSDVNCCNQSINQSFNQPINPP